MGAMALAVAANGRLEELQVPRRVSSSWGLSGASRGIGEAVGNAALRQARRRGPLS